MSLSMRDKGYSRPTARARELRANPTEAEVRLWEYLRASAREVRFNRQVAIGPFICDFAARGIRLAIELDGGQHGTAADRARTRAIESRGYRVIRFWNHDVLANVDGVEAEIDRVIADMPSPSPSRKREGGRPVPSCKHRGLG